MKLFKVVMTICSLALLALVFTPGLRADSDLWNKKTTLTFSEPFEIPGGQILPAGTYVFKLLDSPFDRDIVQIFNEDQTHVYATVLAIPNYRLEAPENTIMRFEERASGSPQAIKAWFHPGNTRGHEFVYPKARAIELAKLTNEPIPSMPTELTPDITTSPADQPAMALEKAPLKAEEPSGEELPISRVFESIPHQVASLPKTASSMPLVGLIGLLSLAAAFALLIVTRRAG
jgi:LPXTG-motif cell wall-anchored protein